MIQWKVQDKIHVSKEKPWRVMRWYAAINHGWLVARLEY
jgi:hypothetical protein